MRPAARGHVRRRARSCRASELPVGGGTAGCRRTWERGRGAACGDEAQPGAESGSARGSTLVPVTEPRVSCYIVIKASWER